LLMHLYLCSLYIHAWACDGVPWKLYIHSVEYIHVVKDTCS
jgi:hypothetical protein